MLLKQGVKLRAERDERVDTRVLIGVAASLIQDRIGLVQVESSESSEVCWRRLPSGSRLLILLSPVETLLVASLILKP